MVGKLFIYYKFYQFPNDELAVSDCPYTCLIIPFYMNILFNLCAMYDSKCFPNILFQMIHLLLLIYSETAVRQT